MFAVLRIDCGWENGDASRLSQRSQCSMCVCVSVRDEMGHSSHSGMRRSTFARSMGTGIINTYTHMVQKRWPIRTSVLNVSSQRVLSCFVFCFLFLFWRFRASVSILSVRNFFSLQNYFLSFFVENVGIFLNGKWSKCWTSIMRRKKKKGKNILHMFTVWASFSSQKWLELNVRMVENSSQRRKQEIPKEKEEHSLRLHR